MLWVCEGSECVYKCVESLCAYVIDFYTDNNIMDYYLYAHNITSLW